MPFAVHGRNGDSRFTIGIRRFVPTLPSKVPIVALETLQVDLANTPSPNPERLTFRNLSKLVFHPLPSTAEPYGHRHSIG
jgi:hypothetical protein